MLSKGEVKAFKCQRPQAGEWCEKDEQLVHRKLPPVFVLRKCEFFHRTLEPFKILDAILG